MMLRLLDHYFFHCYKKQTPTRCRGLYRVEGDWLVHIPPKAGVVSIRSLIWNGVAIASAIECLLINRVSHAERNARTPVFKWSTDTVVVILGSIAANHSTFYGFSVFTQPIRNNKSKLTKFFLNRPLSVERINAQRFQDGWILKAFCKRQLTRIQ